MKILHTVEFYYPSKGGAQEVVQQISECMARLGHDVTVATSKLPDRTSLTHNGVKIVEFAVSGNTVRGMKGEKKKYQDFLKNSKFDIVMNYAAQQWTADAFFEVIDHVSAKKIIVPCGYSALYDPAYAGYFKKLPDILRKYDATVYMAENYRDINFAKEHNLPNLCVIPNGADEKEYGKLITAEEKQRIKNAYGVGGLVLMTIGNHTNEKGHAELLHMFRRLPVSKATLVIAATPKPHDGCFDSCEVEAWRINQSRKLLGKRVVIVDGTDRPAVRDLLRATDIFTFFSNVECSPVVLFEAAAAGVPFIASNAGNDAEIARWTGAGIIVKSHDRPNGRVQVDARDALWQTTRLSHNPKRRQAMGHTGHTTWKKKFTWEKLTDEYLELYHRVLKTKGTQK